MLRRVTWATSAAVLAALVAVAGPAAAEPAAPLTLTAESAVALAMEHSESLGLARSTAARSRHYVREVRADGLPALGATVDYSRNWLLPTFVFNNARAQIGSDNEVAGSLRLTQPLYTGGRVRGSLDAARSHASADGEDARRVRQDVAAGVETAIYDYLLAQELANVVDLAVVRARSNQSQVEALRAAGRVTQYDIMRASVQVAATVSDSIQSGHALALARLELTDRIGLDHGVAIVVDATFRDTTHLTLADVSHLVDTALRHRPERQRLRARERARQGEIRVARSGARPSLDLVALGQLQFQNDALDRTADADEWRRSWSTGLILRVPLFDGMRTRARVAQAREEMHRVELETEQVERRIGREVEEAWMEVTEAGERMRVREGSVDQAQQGLADAASRYRSGRGTQLEVLDAQLALVGAASEVARARRDRAVSLVSLELAVGVLGEDAERRP